MARPLGQLQVRDGLDRLLFPQFPDADLGAPPGLARREDVVARVAAHGRDGLARRRVAVEEPLLVPRRVVHDDGVRGYFRGNLANCIRVVPYSATQFVTFDYCKRVVTDFTGQAQPTIVQRLGCGAMAGICASFATHPLDVIRTRLAVQKELAGITHTITTLWAEGGVGAMYKGLGPTLASLAPFVAINFAAYDTLKARFFPDGMPQGPVYSLGMGATAGIIAQTACYPLDTVRRRMQLKGQNYKSTADAIKTIIQSEGALGMYRGISANTLKVIPNNAIRWMVFEHIKSSPYFRRLFIRLNPPPPASPDTANRPQQNRVS